MTNGGTQKYRLQGNLGGFYNVLYNSNSMIKILPWSEGLIKTKWKFYENNVDNILTKIRILTKSSSSWWVVNIQ